MAHVVVTSEALIIHITGTDRLWALKSHLEIPLAHVSGAAPALDEAESWLKGIHIGGLHMPSVIHAGTFHHEGDRVFWDVHDPRNAIAITLKDDRFARLVVEVDDPTATIAMISRAVQPLAVAH